MIFPRGEVVHKNLSTAFTDLPALLSTLKTEGFSGTIDIAFPGAGVQGVFFLASGEVTYVEATPDTGARRTTGQEALQTLLSLSDHKDGVLSVYRLSPERVALISGHLHHEIVFKELSTNFTRLDRLLLKLRDEKHHGFIEVLTKDHQAMGVLFLDAGEPVEMFTTPESGASVFGRKSIPIFVENTIKQGAVFNVYRTLGKVAKEKKVEEEKKPPEGKKPVPVKAVLKEERKGLEEMIPIVEEILNEAEKVVDGSTQKGTFVRTFKRALIANSEAFDFLDPFAGEFDYRDGTVRFIGEAGEKEFAKGIVESLRATLGSLEREFPRERMLPLKLRAEIESSLEHHRGVLKRLDVEKVFSSFFQ